MGDVRVPPISDRRLLIDIIAIVISLAVIVGLSAHELFVRT